MTFIDKLKTHVNGLIHIKTELYWYKTDKWDGAHESVHLLLDVLDPDEDVMGDISPEATNRTHSLHEPAVVLLFIDGAPKWIWAYESSMEFVK